MTGVRFHEDWEGKCDACAQWWPLTDEFWYPRQGVRRCRACINMTQSRPARFQRAKTAEEVAIRKADRLRNRRGWERARRDRERAA